MRSQTSDLWILHSDTLSLSHRDPMVSKALPCILLGSAVSIASYFLNRIRRKLSCKLGIEIEKDVFFVKASFSISFPSLNLPSLLFYLQKKPFFVFNSFAVPTTAYHRYGYLCVPFYDEICNNDSQ